MGVYSNKKSLDLLGPTCQSKGPSFFSPPNSLIICKISPLPSSYTPMPTALNGLKFLKITTTVTTTALHCCSKACRNHCLDIVVVKGHIAQDLMFTIQSFSPLSVFNTTSIVFCLVGSLLLDVYSDYEITLYYCAVL